MKTKVTEYSAFCKPATPIPRPPMSMARMVGTFSHPGGDASDSVTVEVLVFVSDVYNDPESSEPVASWRDCQELHQAGWHSSSVEDLDVHVRVIPGF
jgi:hypothetical protein